jgi:NADH-quinone oxidoreductase subunit G
LPAATFAEGDGTLINNEGRIQRYFQALSPDPMIQESWRWLRDIMQAKCRPEVSDWMSLDGITNAMFSQVEAFGGRIEVAPESGFRIDGQRVPRQPHRYSGRTAMHANLDINEPRPPDDPDSPLSFSMEGHRGPRPSSLVSFFWAPGWNSVQSVAKYQQEVGGPLRGGDPGVRLIEPERDKKPDYFADIPTSFSPSENSLLIVPLHHIYGSEELSAAARGVSELIPEAYLAIGSEQAEQMEILNGQEVILSCEGYPDLTLPMKLLAGLPVGAVGIPVGLPDLQFGSLPQWGSVTKK